jgi:hypothetical protein
MQFRSTGVALFDLRRPAAKSTQIGVGSGTHGPTRTRCQASGQIEALCTLLPARSILQQVRHAGNRDMIRAHHLPDQRVFKNLGDRQVPMGHLHLLFVTTEDKQLN